MLNMIYLLFFIFDIEPFGRFYHSLAHLPLLDKQYVEMSMVCFLYQAYTYTFQALYL